MIQLIYVFNAHINHLFFKTFYRELKKLSKKLVTFSLFYKKILKQFTNVWLRAPISKTQLKKILKKDLLTPTRKGKKKIQ